MKTVVNNLGIHSVGGEVALEVCGKLFVRNVDVMNLLSALGNQVDSLEACLTKTNNRVLELSAELNAYKQKDSAEVVNVPSLTVSESPSDNTLITVSDSKQVEPNEVTQEEMPAPSLTLTAPTASKPSNLKAVNGKKTNAQKATPQEV